MGALDQMLRNKVEELRRENDRLQKKIDEQRMRGYKKRSIRLIMCDERMTWVEAIRQKLCTNHDYAVYGWNEERLTGFTEPAIWMNILSKAGLDDLSLLGLYHAVRYMFISRRLKPSDTLTFNLSDLAWFSKWKSGLSSKLKKLAAADLIEYTPARGKRRKCEIRLVSASRRKIG